MGNCHAIPLTSQISNSSTLTRSRRRRRRRVRSLLRRQRRQNEDIVSLPSSSSSIITYPTTTTTTTLEELRRIRVVSMGDGSIIDVPNPIPASHINDRNPNFLVCESASLRVGNRPCPLRPAAHLAPGHLYVLLPLPAFQRPLAWSYLHTLASLIDPAPAPAPRPCHRRQVFPLPASESSSDPPYHHQVFSPPSSESSDSPDPPFNNIWSRDITTRDSDTDTDTSLRFHTTTTTVSIDSGDDDDASQLLGLIGPDITMNLPYFSTIASFGDSKTLLLDASHPFNNVCEDSKDALSRYIEQLIERGNSWMPKLDTVEEEQEEEGNSLKANEQDNQFQRIISEI